MTSHCFYQAFIAICLLLLLSAPTVYAQEAAAEEDANPVQKIDLDLHPRFLLFTEPKRPDGTIDYVAALNKKYSEGVTRDSNAFRDLFLIFDHIGQGALEDEWSAIPGQMQMLGYTIEDLKRGPHLLDQYDYFQEIGYDTEAYDERFEADPISAVQVQEVRDWLKKNEPVFERALAALKKPRYWAPLVGSDEAGTVISVLLPSLGQHRMLARGLRDWCYVLLADEQYDKALEVFQALRSLARHSTHHPTLIGNLVGISIDAISFEMLRQCVASRSLPDHVLVKLEKRMRDRAPRVPMADAIRFGEAASGIDAYIQIMSGRLQDSEMLRMDGDFVKTFFGSKPFDISRGVKKISMYYKQLARTLAIEDYASKQRLMVLMEEQYTSEWEAAKQRFFLQVGEAMVPNPAAILNKEDRTDAVTAMFMSIMMPALGSAARTETRSLATELCIYAAIACERYRLKHGKLPEKLSDLVPAFLDTVPTDPFSGEPVLYKQNEAGFTVYCLGDNLEDDGGIEFFDDDEEDQGRWHQRERADWVVEVNWSKK